MCLVLLVPWKGATSPNDCQLYEWVHGVDIASTRSQDTKLRSSVISAVLKEVICASNLARTKQLLRACCAYANVTLSMLSHTGIEYSAQGDGVRSIICVLPLLSICFEMVRRGPMYHQRAQKIVIIPTDAQFNLLGGQVLAFRNDGRLWSLDAWLLAEVSHHYLPFADACLAHVLNGLRELARTELDQEYYNSSTRLAASRLSMGGMRARLRALSCRSERLKGLCQTALAQSALAQSIQEQLFVR